jgi:hypothetical protein
MRSLRVFLTREWLSLFRRRRLDAGLEATSIPWSRFAPSEIVMAGPKTRTRPTLS